MDRHMPLMDGIEATKRIRALDEPENSVSIVALTAAATRREIETCLECGVNDVVTRPIDPRQLKLVLERVTVGEGVGPETVPAAMAAPGRPLDAVAENRSIFIAKVSHDLRSSMNAILENSLMLQENAEEQVPVEELAEFLGSIQLAGDQMLEISRNATTVPKAEVDQSRG